MVVDDMHLLKNAKGRKAVFSLAGRSDIWLILICRSPIPAWLMPLYIKGGFLVITEDDLRLGEKEISAYMESQGLAVTEEELVFVAERSQGNAYTVRHTALKMLEGMRPGPKMAEEIVEAFAAYLESHVMVQWDSDLLEFLMQVSVTDEFTLPLAEMVTGNRYAPELLERAVETGNFLSCEDGTYRLRPQLIRALRRRAAKEYSPQERAAHAYNAGLYYEMQGQIVPALAMFEQCGNKERIRELLIRNARLNPGAGHYFELRRYYLQMEEKELEESPVLMAGMSMLYSLLMQEEESEYWYQKLEQFASTAKGGQKREAVSRLAYLDIALPHRGSADMIDIMKRMPALIFDKGMSLPEFSVTSNYPSTMNGGKDFCHWSREDRKLAATIGKLVERVLGRYGKGLVKVALGESFYEKGEDAYEVLTLLARAKLEAEGGGMIEIAFAAVGLQVRLDTLQGEIQMNAGENTAKITVSGTSFTGKVVKTFTINKATLTTDGKGTAAGTYGAKLSELTVTGPSVKLNGTEVSGTWKLAGDTIPNAGNTETCNATFTPANGGENYNPLKAQVTLNIAKATLTVTSVTIKTRPYKPTYQTAEVSGVTFTGLVNGETLTLGEDYIAYGNYDDPNAGANKRATIVVELKSSAKANNYTLPKDSSVNATGTITAIPIADKNVTLSPASAVYDGTEQKPIVTIAGLTEGTDYTVSYTGDFTKAGAGTATITAIKEGDDNYNEASAGRNVTVAKKALTVRADSKTVVKGNPMPALTYRAEGLVNGDTFTGWSSEDGVAFADSKAKTTTFTMPAKSVTAKANYTCNSSSGNNGGGSGDGGNSGGSGNNGGGNIKAGDNARKSGNRKHSKAGNQTGQRQRGDARTGDKTAIHQGSGRQDRLGRHPRRGRKRRGRQRYQRGYERFHRGSGRSI